MEQCRGFAKNRKPCQMPAGSDGWCFNHRPDPEANAIRQEARSRGGQVGKARTLNPDEVSVDFQTTQDVTELLSSICEWVLTGRLDPKTSNAIVYAASAALRSLDKGDIEQKLDALRAEIDALKGVRSASAA